MQTPMIAAIQIQPMARWRGVPFGRISCSGARMTATQTAATCSWMASGASSSGASDMAVLAPPHARWYGCPLRMVWAR